MRFTGSLRQDRIADLALLTLNLGSEPDLRGGGVMRERRPGPGPAPVWPCGWSLGACYVLPYLGT